MIQLRPFIICFIALAVSTPGHAATAIWNNTGTGAWNVSGNWFPFGPPGPSDAAFFGGPAAIVQFNVAPAAIQSLTINQGLETGPVTFESTIGATLNVTSASGGQDVLLANRSLFLGTSGRPVNLIAGDDLSVTIGNSLNVLFGSNASAADVIVTDNAEIIVDGSGSALNSSVSTTVGASGATSRLTYRNNSDGALASPSVGVSSVAGSTGVLNVETGADITVSGNLSVGTGSAGSGSVNVNSSDSTLVQTGTGSVIVGSASGSTAAVNIATVTSGAALDTGTGGLVVNATGVVNVGSNSTTGIFRSFGPINVAGGEFNVHTGSLFNMIGVGGIHVSAGGSVMYAPGVSINTTVNVTSGGSFKFGRGFNLASGFTLTVDGAGSSLITNTVDSTTNNSSGTIILRNGATADFAAGMNNIGALHVQSGATANFAAGLNSFGTLHVQSGADVTSGDVRVEGSGSTGITIVGAGSSLSLGPGRTLTIGENSFSPGPTVEVLDAAELNLAGGGTTRINRNGTLTIDGGSAYLNIIDMQGGNLNFIRGSLGYAGDLTIGAGGILGTDLTLGNRHLTLSGTTTVDAGRRLVLDGGMLNTGSLVVNGAFHFNSGTLGITTPGTNLNTPIVTNSPSTTINIFATGVTMGQAGSFNGFHHLGTLHVGDNSVTLHSAGYARLGVLTALAGGTINAPNGVVFASGTNLSGHGTVNSRVTGEAGSVIDVSGPLTLGDASSPAGFNFGGELRVRQHTVTLLSSGQATLGNLTSLNVGASPGTLIAANGVVVDFGDAVTGYGTINSSNTLAKRTIINGIAEGVSPSLRLTFTGYVKGVGTFNNVNFTGTFSPGLSPTILTVGNLAFASTNTVIMELGGITPGSEYDVIQSTGELAVGGTLAVSLINGFSPQAGQSFDLFDFAGLSGTFDTLDLPTLTSGLAWNTSQLYTTGVLNVIASASLLGDFNHDGSVNAADYVVWRKGGGVATTPANYDLWRANFGRTNSGGSTANVTDAVPEPHALVFGLTACLSLSVCTSVRGTMRYSERQWRPCPRSSFRYHRRHRENVTLGITGRFLTPDRQPLQL